MTRRAPLVVLLAVLSLATGAPPAASAAAGEDRAAAREFSFAAYRLRVAVTSLAPEVARREAELRSARCGGGVDAAPLRVVGDVRATYIAAYGWVFSDVFRSATVTFMAELDRVPVSDRKLRRGRAAWRRSAVAVRDLPAPPPDLCEQFARWREAGYTPATRPAIPIRSFAAGDADLAAWQRRLDAAARRMRALGVSRSAARRFTGVSLFAGLPGAQSAAVDDRATAREFSFAAYRLRVAVKALGPELARRQREISDCSDVAEKAPRRVRDKALEIYYTAVSVALIDSLRPPLAVFVAELDRIPVEDAALRRGRTVWRDNVADLAKLAPVPADVCDQLRRWKAAGYTEATRPAVDTADFDEDEATNERRERRLRAAVRRMRELGVRRGTAERFTGDNLLDGIPELEAALVE